MKMTYLYGARLDTFARLARDNGVAPWALPRALSIALVCAHNSLMHRREATIDLSAVRVRAPIFVLGHWRSGTTHLQYLLARDPRHATPSTYDVCFPNSLLSGRAHEQMLAPLLPRTRPQDAMAFGMDAPNEDEIALAALGAPSAYHAWGFPGREDEHQRFLSFRRASAEERSCFAVALDGYLRKLTHKYGRRLVLKSPPHTARVALLRELYPDARFVHVHRHPYDVLRSTRHLYATWYRWFAFLRAPDREGADDRIFAIYRELHDAYLDDVASLPSETVHTIAYEALARDPIGTLRGVYAALELGPLPERELGSYVSSLRGYRNNAYDPLPARDRERAAREWARAFDAFGYVP